MLFPVKAYNANGKLKEVISKEILHRRHWKIFHNNEGIYTGTWKLAISKELKDKMDAQFPEGLMNSRN